MNLVFLSADRMGALVEKVNSDPEFRLAARAMCCDVYLKVGEAGTTFRIEQGQIRSARINPFLEPCDFSIAGTEDTWTKLLSRKPPPFYNHLYPAMFRGNLRFEGNLEGLFSSLAPLSRMVDLMRMEQNKGEGIHGHA